MKESTNYLFGWKLQKTLSWNTSLRAQKILMIIRDKLLFEVSVFKDASLSFWFLRDQVGLQPPPSLRVPTGLPHLKEVFREEADHYFQLNFKSPVWKDLSEHRRWIKHRAPKNLKLKTKVEIRQECFSPAFCTALLPLVPSTKLQLQWQDGSVLKTPYENHQSTYKEEEMMHKGGKRYCPSIMTHLHPNHKALYESPGRETDRQADRQTDPETKAEGIWTSRAPYTPEEHCR